MRNQQDILVSHDRLRWLVEVARAGGFAQAAARLGVTPQAVSLQMKALERELDVALFERIGRRNALTREGAELAGLAEGGLLPLEESVREALSRGNRVRGTIRIGGPAPLSRVWLRPRLVKLLDRYPDLNVDLRFEVPSILATRLAAGELDFCLLMQLSELPGLEQRLIHREEFVAVASPAYLAKSGTPSSAEEFLAHPYVVFDDDLPMHRSWWRAAFGSKVAGDARIRVRAANLYEMLGLVEAGVGLSVLPSYFVAESLAQKRVKLLPPRREGGVAKTAVNSIHLAWRKAAPRTARFTAVQEALLSNG